MTDKQENKLRMYLTVSAVCESNVEVWQDNDMFKSAFELFCLKDIVTHCIAITLIQFHKNQTVDC